MVHFSSAISLSSGALTGAYTAANTFLNYFSNFQRYSLGAKSFSMAWSTWKNRGMSMGSESNELLKLKGFLDIQPDQGLNSLLAGLTSDEPEIYIGLDKANSNIRSMLTEEFLSDTKQDDTQTSPHSNHVPANSETEKKLVEIWQSLLKQPRIGITDNYFQLGGTSLIAARMFGQIQKTFNKNLPLSSLFKFATIEELAGLIDEGRDSPTEHEESFFQIIEIQKGGNKPPFFIIPGAGSDVVVFRSLAQLLGQAQPCYGLQAKGLDATDTGGKYFSVQDTAKEYVKLIKKTQSKGPFYVGGHCFGSLLAFEVAQQLGQQGDEVAVLALFDPLLGDEQSLEMFGTARLRYHFSRFFKASLAEKMGYIFTRIKNLSRTLIVKKRLNRSIEQVRTMYDNYEFCIYPSEITVFLAEDSFYKLFNDKDPRRIWSLHSRKPVVYIDTKGNHDSIINGQEVKYLAEKLALILEDKQHA
jgi:thioesterase domain-containing protein/acyl carrier protein